MKDGFSFEICQRLYCVSNLKFNKLPLDQNGSDPSPAELVFDSADIHIVDLQQFTPLGGVFYFDVFHLPPQSRIVKGWEMREVHLGL